MELRPQQEPGPGRPAALRSGGCGDVRSTRRARPRPPPAATIATSQTVTLQADFSADSAETFPVWNVVTLTLDIQRESLRVSWFATGGSFEHDVTGRSETDPETFTQNVWHAPETPGPVYLWTVLRDDRGGIDFAAAEIDVTQ